MTTHGVRKGLRTMLETILPLAIVVGVWLLLQLVVLPKLGVPS